LARYDGERGKAVRAARTKDDLGAPFGKQQAAASPMPLLAPLDCGYLPFGS